MFYIFHGEDEHTKREFISELQERLGDSALIELNTSRFQGQGLTFSELKHSCESIPFLTNRRLVIVDDLLASKPSYLEELLEYVPSLPGTTRLVFCESKRLAESHPIIQLARQSEFGYVKFFKPLEGRDLSLWIMNQVKERGGQISPRAAHLLAINVGNDLSLLHNEVEKLVLFKSKETIDDNDVSLLSPFVAEASIFDLVDALGSRHRRTASEILHSKLAEGAEPEFIFAMIIRQYRLLIQVKELALSGSKPPEIAANLNIHGFVAGKLHAQSQNYDMVQLEQIYSHLLEVDIHVKTGKTELGTALPLLVAGLVT